MIKHCQKGMTLIEILAILIIFTIISLFIFSITISSSKQQIEQTNESLELQDGSYILKQITKDLRKSYKIDISTKYDSSVFYFQDKNANTLFTYEYKNNNDELYRNNVLIGNSIEEFSIVGDERVTLKFKLKNKEFETSITFRRGTSK